MSVYSPPMDEILSKNSDIAILIPARLAASRLPEKPLAMIADAPMIVHVWRRGIEAGLGRVVVAAGEKAIFEAVEAAGGEAVLTDPDLPSGSDRILAALQEIDPEKNIKTVINLQGDLPVISQGVIARSLLPLEDSSIDIATLVCPLNDRQELADPNIVKALIDFEDEDVTGEASDFCRILGPQDNPAHAYHHIGIYAYRRAALEKFVSLEMSESETLRKLEQMRALDNGMRIGAALVDTVPRGVDTPADLEWAKRAIKETINEQ